MRRVRLLFLAAGVLLGGCDRGSSGQEEKTVDARSPLEIAARERGVVQPEAEALTGVFERAHDLGRDAMCVVPDGAGRWRFALTAAFGSRLACRAHGTIARDGDGWRLNFAGGDDCTLTLREEDDELRWPGRLPGECESLCPGRTTLAGLRLPRASWSAADARGLRMRDAAGNIVQPCAD